MSRIHIGKNGPAKCKAKTEASCTVNGIESDGSSEHYDSMEEATKAYEEKLSQQYTLTGTQKKESNPLTIDEKPLMDRLNEKISSIEQSPYGVRVSFDNGYGVSIISHPGSYGGEKGLYEIGVLDKEGNLTYETPITDDVIGHLNESQVAEISEQIANLTNDGKLDTEKTQQETEDLLEDLPYTDTYEVSVADNEIDVDFSIGGINFNAYSDSSEGVDGLESVIKDRLHDFNANDYFEEEHDSDVERLKSLYESEEKIKLALNNLEESGKSYETLQDKINERTSHFSIVSSDVPNEDVYNDDNVNELIEDYELDYSNSEVFEQDGETFIIIEAPNHATFQVVHNSNSDGDTVGDVRRSLTQMREFDADEQFDELWSPEFGARNGFTATDFYVGLKADEEYFKQRADHIEKDIGN